MREHIDAFQLEYYQPLGNPTKFIRALISHFSRAKDEGYDPETYRRGIESEAPASEDERRQSEELAGAYHTYETLLHHENVLDFGGLILYTVKLFQARPHILRRYRDQFRFVMVDEFQDTNTAQYELIKLLVGRDQNVTVVGDDDQAIYRFRGASVENILLFERDFPQAKRVILTKTTVPVNGFWTWRMRLFKRIIRAVLKRQAVERSAKNYMVKQPKMAPCVIFIADALKTKRVRWRAR